MFVYLLETASIMSLSFIRFELLSFEHGNPISHKILNIILWLFFVKLQSNFLPIYFLHIFFISGKPHLFSWERLDISIFVCTS